MSRKGKTTTSTTPARGRDFNATAAEDLFNNLCDPDDPDEVTMEGIGKLCEMLEIDPAADVRGLVLMWKLGAVSKPGQISREEYMRGMQNLGVSDLNGLRGILPSFDPGFLERSEFRGIFLCPQRLLVS
jgi:hypothetical protein